MKIVLNTRTPDAVASSNYRGAFASLPHITLNDWENYETYDVALFMTYQEDLEELARVKKIYPSLKTGIIDPRGSWVEKYIPYTDFLILDSLEMKDFFAKYQRPMFYYYEYPDIQDIHKQHTEKEPLIIGYHGNKTHLACMYPNVTTALELLGQHYPLEFWAMYNIERLGKWQWGVPQNISVKHIQWSENNFYEYLTKVDIGIVPNIMPLKDIEGIKLHAIVNRNVFADSPDDYLLRFKMPSNPGRFIIFGKLGIPVVCDFFPSALQFIRDEENGLLAYSAGGWYRALESLITSVEMRQRLADRMRDTIAEYFAFPGQNEKLLNFFSRMLKQDSHISSNAPLPQPALDSALDAWYTLTKDSLQDLREQGISEKIANKLKPLKYQDMNEAEFRRTIEEVLGKRRAKKYHERIQESAETTYMLSDEKGTYEQ